MKKIIYIALMLPLFLSSCEDDSYDSVFDQSPEDRIFDIMYEYENAIESAEFGWKTVYFPNDEKYGGYSFIFKFDGLNDKVKMYSDLIKGETSVSTYRFQQQQEPSIVFDSHGLLHELSDPINGERGKGFDADFEFYFRDIRNDSIFLEGKLNKEPLVLTKATADDVDELPNNFDVLPLLASNPLESVFRNIIVEGKDLCSFSYSERNRSITIGYVNENGELVSKTIGFGLNSDGIFFNEPIDVNGVMLNNFKYNEVSGLFEDEKISAIIDYSNFPGAPLPYYEFGSLDNGRYNYLEPNKSSAAWSQFYESYLKDLENFGIELTRIYMRTLSEDLQTLQLYTNLGTVIYEFTYEVKDDGKVYFTFTGATNASQQLTDIFQPLLDILLGSSKGYYVQDTGGLLQYTNGTFSLINADYPQFEINYYDFD